MTFLVWPLSVARICSELLSNTMTFLSAPPGNPSGKCWDGSLGPTTSKHTCLIYLVPLQIPKNKEKGIHLLRNPQESSLTREDLVGVGRTQIQGKNSRDAGAVQPLCEGEP